jgi:hypothetical protein
VVHRQVEPPPAHSQALPQPIFEEIHCSHSCRTKKERPHPRTKGPQNQISLITSWRYRAMFACFHALDK